MTPLFIQTAFLEILKSGFDFVLLFSKYWKLEIPGFVYCISLCESYNTMAIRDIYTRLYLTGLSISCVIYNGYVRFMKKTSLITLLRRIFEGKRNWSVFRMFSS